MATYSVTVLAVIGTSVGGGTVHWVKFGRLVRPRVLAVERVVDARVVANVGDDDCAAAEHILCLVFDGNKHQIKVGRGGTSWTAS